MGRGAPAGSSTPFEPVTLVADARDAGKRLDAWLTEALREAGVVATREAVKRALARGDVEVEGAAAPSAKVRLGLRARVLRFGEPERSAARPEPGIELSIAFEDEHLLVVDKPAGLVVHPARGHWEGTLVGALLARGRLAPGDARDPSAALRPGIVHRIDKGTSGLLVVAKDLAAREGLAAAFARHDLERAYLAIARGRVESACLASLHGRHPTSRLRFTTRVASGRRAVTHVEALEAFVAPRVGSGPGSCLATLVRCRLETGRTHQIRVHLAELADAPLLGDALYGGNATDPRVAAVEAALGRPALHAAVLGFVHPVTGRTLRFESPLPPDFARALEALRLTRASTSGAPST